MSTIETGGPAFARSAALSHGGQTGMTLRDYFAAKAMQAYITSQIDLTADNVSICAEENVAAIAYQFADAMLAARKASPEAATTCEKCTTPDLCRELGRACDPYPGEA